MSELVKENRILGPFSKIRVRSFAHIELSQGETESVVIEALASSQNLIKTEVQGDTLVLSYTWQAYLWPRKFNAYIKVKNLEGIYFEGAGDLKAEPIKAQNVQIRISGSGKVEAELEANDVDIMISGAGSVMLVGSTQKQGIHISGAGSVNAEGFKSMECDVNISGSGSAKVNAATKLDVVVSGSGSVAYTGSPQVNQQIMGIGRVYSLQE